MEEDEEFNTGFFSMICCYMCMCVNGCFSLIFEDAIDYAADGTKTMTQYFNYEERQLDFVTKLIRCLCVFLSIVGFYLIFTPIILLLKWIPLVGAFLGACASICAGLIAFVVGLTLSLLNMALAWLMFRPLVSVGLLTLAGIGGYLLFFWNPSAAAM